MKGHEDSNPDVAFEALVRAQLTRMGYDASAVPDEVDGARQTFVPSSSLPQNPTSNTALPSLRCYAPSCASTTLRRTRLRL